MTVPKLWSISYSPWSDKARWALDHCEVEYRRRAYQPLLGEPALRWTLGRWWGPVSVPILETDDGVIADSYEIAQWADAHATRDELRIFAAEHEAEIRRLNELSETALAAGRDLGLRGVLRDDQALFDLVPGHLRRLGPVARAIAAGGVRRTLRKYAAVTPADPGATLREVLEMLREALAATKPDAEGQRHLLGSFSYADIVMAEALAFVAPPASHLRLSEASKRAYLRPELARQFEDLVAWRDGLYARRKPDRKHQGGR